jgi:AcrR family transcriptional regulator
MSHSLVLHHFGSREGLIRAVVEQAGIMLQEDLVRALGPIAEADPEGAALLERVADTFSRRGHARLMAWLLLSGYNPLDSPVAPIMKAGWEGIARATHARRLKRTGSRKQPSYEDTRFTVVLAWLGMFGEAVAGSAVFNAAGWEPDPALQHRFRKWFARMLERHLEDG